MEGGAMLTLPVERSESGARGENPPPPSPRRAAEAFEAGLKGVRVANRHLG